MRDTLPELDERLGEADTGSDDEAVASDVSVYAETEDLGAAFGTACGTDTGAATKVCPETTGEAERTSGAAFDCEADSGAGEGADAALAEVDTTEVVEGGADAGGGVAGNGAVGTAVPGRLSEITAGFAGPAAAAAAVSAAFFATLPFNEIIATDVYGFCASSLRASIASLSAFSCWL